MTQPNLHVIRHRLAEWLGWELRYESYLQDGEFKGTTHTWRPDERWDHAGMLLDKITKTHAGFLDNEGDGWCMFVGLKGTLERVSHEFAPTAPLAITLAVYAAVGGGE